MLSKNQFFEDFFIFAKNKDTLRQFGAFLGFGFNDHNPNFQKLPGIPNCCQGFTNGFGTGISAGVFIEMPLPYNLFAGLRTSFSQLNGWLKEHESTWVRLNNNYVSGLFEHNLKSQIDIIALEPYFRFKVFERFNLFVGGKVGLIVTKKYNQWEELVEPKDRGVFVDTRTRIRNKYSGDIPEIKPVQSDFHFGMGYDIPLDRNKSFFLMPLFSFRFGLNDLVRGIKWKVNTLQLAISIKYVPKTIEKPKPPEKEYLKRYLIDTIVIENLNIKKTHFVLGIEKIDTTVSDGGNKITIIEKIRRTDTIFKKPKPIATIETNTASIKLETQFVTQAFPLLPIVFFENNSEKILEIYSKIENPTDFNYEKLPVNPFELNKQILNIIGYRLKEKPKSKIKIIGYSDSTSEMADCNLAFRRATSVKNYLIRVWQIEPERIAIHTEKKNCYPKDRTITQNDSGFSENRRIQIISNDPEVLQPISKKRFLEVLDFSPKVLNFDPSKSLTIGVKSWSLKVSTETTILSEHKGIGEPKLISEEINEKIVSLLKENQTLYVEFKLEDDEGNVSIDKKQIAIVNDTNEIEIQRLSLILFKVSSSEIPSAARDEITKFLSVNSELTQARILGFSDILGDRDFNYSLSRKRAEKTMELVKNIDPNIEIIDIKGLGSSQFPPGITSYLTPAERFLSRTVYIELIKKWK
ncbi:MAG: hypothetical protein N2517_00035 [Ignavibacteria bacterium]|nr:hypothetical protein [Ignavibacteria bacterium]